MKGARLLEAAGIPALPTPARATKAIWALVAYGHYLKKIQTQSSKEKS